MRPWLTALPLLLLLSPLAAQDGAPRKAGQAVGNAVRETGQAGKRVGHAFRDGAKQVHKDTAPARKKIGKAGRDIGHGFRDAARGFGKGFRDAVKGGKE